MPTFTSSQRSHPSVLQVIGSCTRTLVLGGCALVAILAAVIGFALAMPHVVAATSSFGDQWLRRMAHGEVAMKIPTLMFWGSVATVLWSGCIVAKLVGMKRQTLPLCAFMGLAVVALAMGVIPSSYVLYESASDWNLDWVMQQGNWIIAGAFWLIVGTLVVALGMQQVVLAVHRLDGDL